MAFATRSALHAARRAAVATTRPVAARGAASCASSAWDCEPPVLSEPFDRRVGASSRTEPLIVSSAEEALGHVLTDSCKVFLHTAAATPTALVEAMPAVAKAKDLKGIECCHLHVEGPVPHMLPENRDRFRDKGFFTGANARTAVNNGCSEYVPIFLSEVPLLFRRGIQPIDVALISVSPADAHGFHSLGPSVDVTRAALQAAKKVVAVINPKVPRTFGDGNIHTSHIDIAIERDMPMHNLHRKNEGGPEEEAIGKLIAENLVRDGATLQMGIGGIPDAVLRYCKNHKDLGIHSEMFSDGILELVNSGVITNRHKTFEAGKITGGFAIGSQKLYDFMHDNAGLVMLDISYVNDTAVIRRQPKMTAINSCIEIDITGQIVSDSIGTRVFSGVGGQMDFIRGASLCPDGRAIIAMPSTTRHGESRIVPFLKAGGGVVTTRAHAHYVVTEWGIVDLFGKTLQERARLLISIAHPDHRASLTAMAKERGL